MCVFSKSGFKQKLHYLSSFKNNKRTTRPSLKTTSMNTDESIIKHWLIPQKRDSLLVLMTNKKLYKGIIKNGDKQLSTQQTINNGHIPKGLFSIPLSYIKRLQYQAESNIFEIYLSKEDNIELNIPEQETRADLFTHLQNYLKAFQYRYEEYSWFKASKKPLIALLILNLLLTWGYYVAHQIESGVYIREHFIIILAIASLGTALILLIAVIINSLLLFRIIMKIKNAPKMHILEYIKHKIPTKLP